MANGYTRQHASSIIPDHVISSSDLNGEFDGVAGAFDATTGHTHDGTTGGGAPIDYTKLNSKPTLGSAAALNIGTDPLNIVQIDASGKLPALDASRLVNITQSGFFPSQTGNANKFLGTDGTNVTWSAPLPSQTSNAGKVLTTDGTSVSWGNPQLLFQSTLGSGGTLGSPGIYFVSTSAAGQVINLPDTTSLIASGIRYIIFNTGSYQFYLRDASGMLKVAPLSGQTLAISLLTAGTVAGIWNIANMSYGGEIVPNTLIKSFTVIRTAAGSNISITPLSATTAVMTWTDTSTLLYFAPLTITSGVLQVGTVVSSSSLISSATTITALNSTQAIVAYINSSTSQADALVITISGTGASATVTMGTVLILGSANPGNFRITSASVSSTKVIVVYSNVSNQMQTTVLTGAGTGSTATVTASAIVTFGGSGTNPTTLSIDALVVGSSYIFCYGSDSGTYIFIIPVSSGVIGTPTSAFSPVGGIIQGTVLGCSVTAITSTTAIVVFSIGPNTLYATNIFAYLMSISGTTMSISSTNIYSSSSRVSSVVKMGGNKLLVFCGRTSMVLSYNLSDKTLTFSNENVLQLNSRGQGNDGFSTSPLIPLGNGLYLTSAGDINSYPTIEIIEVGV